MVDPSRLYRTIFQELGVLKHNKRLRAMKVLGNRAIDDVKHFVTIINSIELNLKLTKMSKYNF